MAEKKTLIQKLAPQGSGYQYNQVAEPVRSDYGITPNDLNNQAAFDMWKSLATEGGPSRAAQYSIQQNLMNRGQQIDAATQQQAGALAGARSQLAMRGGLGTGASERLAGVGMENLMKAKQGAYGQANENLLDILKQDELGKRQALGSLTELEQSRRAENMGLYKMDLDKWAAGKQADAQVKAARSSSSGGNSVICTYALEKGLLDKDLYDAGVKFTETMNPAIIRGYHWWAVPYVEVMRKHPSLEKIVIPLMQARAEEVAFKVGLRKKGNLLGKLVRIVGEPICHAIGLVVSQKDWSRLYV